MKSKAFSFVLSALIFMCLSMTLVSALSVSIVSSSYPTNTTHNAGTLTFAINVTNDNATYAANNINLVGTSSIGTLSIASIGSIPASSSQLTTATLTFPSGNSGSISITNIIANATLNGTTVTSSAVSANSITILQSSAISLSASVSSISRSQNSTITVTNTGNTVLTNLIISSSGDFTLNTSSTSISSLNPGSSSSFLVSSTAFSSLVLGAPKVDTITVNNTAAQATTQITAQPTYCLYGDIGGNLTISDYEVSKTGDDNIWKPLEDVEIRFHVYNRNIDTTTSISTYAQLELYSASGSRYLDLDKISVGSIKGGNDKLVKFNFTVPSDISDGTAYLYIKAYQNGYESQVCTSQVDSDLSKAITIERQDEDSKLIAFTNEQFDSQPGLCGTENTLRMTVSNVGNTNQNNIKLTLVNSELGVNDSIVLSDLSEGDSTDVSFPITIPNGAVEKTYSFDLKTRYNIRDDTDIDPNLDSSYDYVRLDNPSMIVSGTQCSGTNTTSTVGSSSSSITAQFSPDTPKAIIGQQVIVEATVKNTGTTSSTYSIGVSGNSDWSTVATIDPQTFTLDAGESKQVGIYLNINDNTTVGSKEFTITATSGSVSTQQKVQVNVEKGLTTDSILNNIKSNWFVYVIVLVNLVLIIAIVLVVRSLMKKA